MKNMMNYKGYYGSVQYNDEDRLFHGKLEFIRSLVSYEGTDTEGLRKAFEEAVEDYLDLCEEEGIEAEQSFVGSFNVRAGSDLHRRAVLFAREKGINLDRVVTEALEKYLSEDEKLSRTIFQA